MITDYRKHLADELADRAGRNPLYSLRSFARDLGLYASHLSMVLKGEAGLSQERASAIADTMGWSEKQRREFLLSVEALHSRSRKKRVQARKTLGDPVGAYTRLEQDQFQLISDWYHLPLVELLRMHPRGIPAARAVEHFSRRLSIQSKDVKAALERLTRVGLVTLKQGRYSSAGFPYVPSSPVSDSARRKYHVQMLARAQQSLFQDAVSERHAKSSVYAVDPSLYGEVVQAMQEFYGKVDSIVARSQNPSRVYALNIQWFPLEKEKV